MARLSDRIRRSRPISGPFAILNQDGLSTVALPATCATISLQWTMLRQWIALLISAKDPGSERNRFRHFTGQSTQHRGFMDLAFSNVLYLPDLTTNLISTRQLHAKGVYYSLGAIHTADATVVGETFDNHGLPHLRLSSNKSGGHESALNSRELKTSTADVSLA